MLLSVIQLCKLIFLLEKLTLFYLLEVLDYNFDYDNFNN